jgi:hypothetical protein
VDWIKVNLDTINNYCSRPSFGRNLKSTSMKLSIKIFLILVAIFIVSCKKETPYYQIPDYLKQYFVFQKGSYWIYTNDSTNSLDSTFVNNELHGTQGIGDDGRHLYSFDWIKLYYTSQFLKNSEISYSCPGPNGLSIAGIYTDLNGNILDVTTGPLAFVDGWQPTQNIYSQNCLGNEVFTYQYLPEVVINDIQYDQIIYSKIISIDTSLENSNYYVREIYFAKYIGILKYIETIRHYNIQRSWSLKKYKIIQ